MDLPDQQDLTTVAVKRNGLPTLPNHFSRLSNTWNISACSDLRRPALAKGVEDTEEANDWANYIGSYHLRSNPRNIWVAYNE